MGFDMMGQNQCKKMALFFSQIKPLSFAKPNAFTLVASFISPQRIIILNSLILIFLLIYPSSSTSI